MMSWWHHDATPVRSSLYGCGPAGLKCVWTCLRLCRGSSLSLYLTEDWRQASSVLPPSFALPPPADRHKHGIVGRQRGGQCWSQLRGHWRRCTQAAWRRALCTLDVSSAETINQRRVAAARTETLRTNKPSYSSWLINWWEVSFITNIYKLTHIRFQSLLTEWNKSTLTCPTTLYWCHWWHTG